MKKLQILIVGLIAVLALGATTMAVAKKGKQSVKTTIDVSYKKGSSTDPYDPFANAKFEADVNSKKSKCVKDRKVVVKTKNGEKVGSDLTNSKGEATIKASGFGKGKYTATVKKETYSKVICKEADANVNVN